MLVLAAVDSCPPPHAEQTVAWLERNLPPGTRLQLLMCVPHHEVSRNARPRVAPERDASTVACRQMQRRCAAAASGFPSSRDSCQYPFSNSQKFGPPLLNCRPFPTPASCSWRLLNKPARRVSSRCGHLDNMPECAPPAHTLPPNMFMRSYSCHLHFATLQPTEVVSVRGGSSDDIGTAILGRARAVGADMLAIAPHTRTAKQRVLQARRKCHRVAQAKWGTVLLLAFQRCKPDRLLPAALACFRRGTQGPSSLRTSSHVSLLLVSFRAASPTMCAATPGCQCWWCRARAAEAQHQIRAFLCMRRLRRASLSLQYSQM